MGGDLNIEISFVQYNTTVMLERAASAEQIPLSGGGIYYMLSGFDASSAGVSEVTLVNLYSVGQTLSASDGITTEPVLIGSWGITVYGYAASADVNLVTDKTEYFFGEAVSAAFEIEFGGETVVMPPMETRYDVTKVGEVEYFARYMDDWYSVIIRVNDYCTELLPVEDAVVDYGVVTTPKDLTLPQRLARIEEGVTALIEKFRPENIAVEELFFSKNITNGPDRS